MSKLLRRGRSGLVCRAVIFLHELGFEVFVEHFDHVPLLVLVDTKTLHALLHHRFELAIGGCCSVDQLWLGYDPLNLLAIRLQGCWPDVRLFRFLY